MKKIVNSKTGISLITLAITIVVIIILAATVILTLGNNNPIDQAKKASFLSNMSTFRDELEMYSSNLYITTNGKFQGEKLSADENSVSYKGSVSIDANNIYDILKSLKGSKYDGKIVISDGEISFKYEKGASKKELEWAEDGKINISGIKISTKDELKKIGNDSMYPLNGYYELTCNIDLEGNDADQWVPIGSENSPFTGGFNGKGYTIRGIYINDSSKNNVGLFGCTKGAMFKALSVEGSVKGNTKVGGIIANAIDTKVDNCNNYCNLNSKLCIGGIVAKFEAINKDVSISNCQNYGDIFSSGVKLIGGIVGYCDNEKNEVKFEYCTNYGNISQENQESPNYQVAGICGFARENTVFYSCANCGEINAMGSTYGIVSGYVKLIENCYNTGNITTFDGYTAGIADTPKRVINCYNKASITAKGNAIYPAGGILSISKNVEEISNCYNLGNIKGYQNIGGIIGCLSSKAKINNCYNKGEVIAKNWTAGGIVGWMGENANKSVIQNCYNTKEVFTDGNIGGIIGGIDNTCDGIKISNCYNVGKITSNLDNAREAGIIGGLNSLASDKLSLENCYYLNSMANVGIYGYEDINTNIEGMEEKNMKEVSFLDKLGNEFKKDTKNLNNGYPILGWE